MQHATCTEGPSLPTDSPEAMTNGYFCSMSFVYENGMWTHERQALDEEGCIPKEPLHDEAS